MYQIKVNYLKDIHNGHAPDAGQSIHEALIPTIGEARSKFNSLYQVMNNTFPYKNRNYNGQRASETKYEIWSNLSKSVVVEIELEEMTEDMVTAYEQFLDDEADRKFAEREAALEKAFRRRNELSDQPECLVEADKRENSSNDEE